MAKHSVFFCKKMRFLREFCEFYECDCCSRGAVGAKCMEDVKWRMEYAGHWMGWRLAF